MTNALFTEIYATLGENEVLHTRPSTIHFKGFVIGKKYTQKLVSKLYNCIFYFHSHQTVYYITQKSAFFLLLY